MLRTLKKHHKKIILTAPILFLMVSSTYTPKGNGVFLKPTTFFPEINSPLSVELNFNSEAPFNATDGQISFPPDLIRADNIDTTNTDIDLWGATPELSNSTGVITWSGGIIHPQIINGRQSGSILKISMTPKQPLPIKIFFKEASLLAANGTGNNIINTATGIKIYPHPKNTPSPDIDGDKLITARDVAQVMAGVSKRYNPKLDINGDKTVNYKDVNQIVVYYNELNK